MNAKNNIFISNISNGDPPQPSGDPPATLQQPSCCPSALRRPSDWRPRIEHEIFVNRTNKFCVKCTYYG